MRLIPTLSVLLLLSIGTALELPASAAQSESHVESRKLQAPSTANTVGIGALGYSPGGNDPIYSFIVEGHNHFEQRETYFQIRQYGFGQSRLEIGGGFGIRLAATSGVTLYGVDDTGGWIAPHLGVEPFSGQINWNTSDRQESFYQWFPMASAGFQIETSACRILPLVKAGGAAGNYEKSGLLPRFSTSYGSSFHLNCAGLDLGAEIIRLNQSKPVDFGALDFAIHPTRTNFKMGIRAEGFLNRADSGLSETRLMLILRTHPFS